MESTKSGSAAPRPAGGGGKSAKDGEPGKKSRSGFLFSSKNAQISRDAARTGSTRSPHRSSCMTA